MEIQLPDMEPRGKLHDRYSQLTTEGLVALYLEKYAACERIFSEQYKLLFEAQDQENRRIHKGLALHNRGLALFHMGTQEEAIRSILLAYIEDTLNVRYDLEDNADRTLAASVLRDVFYFRLRILREIKTTSAKIKASGKWNEARDPESILLEIAKRLKFDPNKLVGQCERPLPKIGKPLLGFPQPREKRVFIGTNYDAKPGVIPIAKEAVIRKGYTPVVVAEVGIEVGTTHATSLVLLHTCKYAVFDITVPGGQLMEIERTKDYEVEVLLLREVLSPRERQPRVSEMLSTLGCEIKCYSDPRDLLNIIPRFLP